jgi:hypothetical protein
VRSAAALCALALALGGCGGSTASPADQRQVTRILPEARDIHCTHPHARLTRCRARVRKVPVGSARWDCEFSVDRVVDPAQSGGTEACWSEDGSPESLRPMTATN